jgi:hypothetical protein
VHGDASRTPRSPGALSPSVIIRAKRGKPIRRSSSGDALAHLQLGRAYATQGDTAKARAAYQDFLTLWKDADPDIPIFIAAKSEYAKLK